MKTFKSILAFQKHFDTDEKCRLFLEEQRWGGTPACPHCGSVNVCRFATDNRIFKCREKACRKKFSVTVGTIYENTKIPLTKWFLASYILTNHSKGISSLQLAIWLDVTQKTAWFINHRLREMLADKQPALLSNMVECDETYVGGKNKNRHAGKKKVGRGCHPDKAIVWGAVERSGKVTTKIIEKVNQETVKAELAKTVKQGSMVYTDEAGAYHYIGGTYQHSVIMHSRGEYVRGSVHTNTIEGFWSLLKKQINGIHHSVSKKHLQRYCNEAAYRYNQKALAQDERFANAIQRCEGRLKYQDLIDK